MNHLAGSCWTYLSMLTKMDCRKREWDGGECLSGLVINLNAFHSTTSSS